MSLVVLATVPTEAVLEGFLPAARALDLPVLLLTDDPPRWPALDEDVRRCDVHDAGAVLDLVTAGDHPAAVFSNSDHLQVPTALIADYLGLPGKDWRAALRGKDKGLMRRTLAGVGLHAVWARQVVADEPLPADLPLPAVVKPRSGVASEDVYLVATREEAQARVAEIAARRPGVPLLVEEFLDGPLHTLETLGDGRRLRVLGGFRTTLGPPPTFVEERLDWCPDLPGHVQQQVLDQLAALGVGFGACHTEFVVDRGRARLVEVNYRVIGDSCEFLLADLLNEPLFEHVLRLHLGDSLPQPAPPAAGHARVEYPCAERSGVLVEAPGRFDLDGPVRVSYRPMRAVGEHRELTGTNRDYLGVVRAVGPDRRAVDAAVERFLAEHTWRVAA
ncbi:MAG: siderophore biosynthesis protein [Actinobacteria bacterium]|nr:siderophore biosynthesis protein [Actinomycetota bacterium]MBW3646160.1 siderophore biosynthesis protein [Actinomycetota bacterium]